MGFFKINTKETNINTKNEKCLVNVLEEIEQKKFGVVEKAFSTSIL
jgi:hypothetical protein